MNSVWIKDINKPEFPALNRDIKTDVLIIGGGMAGILCAYIECDYEQRDFFVYSLNNRETPTAPRCQHLGCALKYNPHEHSRDCPCHGSRFDEKGRLLDNPATDDKSM